MAPARERLSPVCHLSLLLLGEQPATLLEKSVHIVVELEQSLIDCFATANCFLTVLEDFGCDLLPLGNFRSGNDAIQLLAKCASVAIVGERRVTPSLSARGEITGQFVKLKLNF